MPTTTLALALVLACAGDPPPEPAEAPPEEAAAPEPEPEPEPARVPVTKPPQADVAWSPVWPVVGGGAQSPGGGHIVSATGARPTGIGTRCLDGVRVDGGGAIWLDNAPPELPPAPATQAVAVERAAWRLGDVLGPTDKILPGGRGEIEPARYAGALVRSVRKTRRMGPPVLTVVGERDGEVAVMITDRDAADVLAAVVFEVPGPPYGLSAALPVVDLDGDGTLDLVVYADPEGGTSYRASLAVDLGPEPTLTLLRVDTREPVNCPAP